MQILQTLGVALGLASLAGLNLYLTVFVTSLAIEQHWIDVSQTYPDLMILGHPAIIAVSGTLYLLQFFADKIPWVDSLWDAIHTFIRPVGGAFLAIRVLGAPDPVFDVIACLLAGSVTLLTHGMKAGTRLVVNHSPEPFSNIALSVTEDAAVLGGLVLIHTHPVVGLAVFTTLGMSIAAFAPKLYRGIKAQSHLILKKISSPPSDQLETELQKTLPHELDVAFHTTNPKVDQIAWAVPCISTSTKGITGNLFGYIVATERRTPKLWFIAKRRWHTFAEEIDLTTYKVAHESKFLSENIVFYSLKKKPKYLFVFHRGQRHLVKGVTASMLDRLTEKPEPREFSGPSAKPLAVA